MHLFAYLIPCRKTVTGKSSRLIWVIFDLQAVLNQLESHCNSLNISNSIDFDSVFNSTSQISRQTNSIEIVWFLYKF